MASQLPRSTADRCHRGRRALLLKTPSRGEREAREESEDWGRGDARSLRERRGRRERNKRSRLAAAWFPSLVSP
ncbi:hypothetical protein MRX96_058091 [Rhipicephalus microplus]